MPRPLLSIRSVLAFLLVASTAALPTHSARAEPAQPALIVAIAVDQFSGDLFARYRGTFTGGLGQLSQGVVFPNGYQSHAATETCPGHSTILSGSRPARTGIIANYWIDQSIDRNGSSVVYCVEDPTKPGTSARANPHIDFHYAHLTTLGDRLKKRDPASRVIAVSGKDRAAMMMGGKSADQIWWWSKGGFATLPGRPGHDTVKAVSDGALRALGTDQVAMAMPPRCAPQDMPVTLANGGTVGTGRFARKAGEDGRFRASPELDTATLNLAAALFDAENLGRNGHVDLLAISLSATDYIGHTYGTAGAEMCIQIDALDRRLGDFFKHLDETGIDYVVVLTADHGGHDAPERNENHAAPDAARVQDTLTLKSVNAFIESKSGVKGALIADGGLAIGDLYVRKDVPKAKRKAVLKWARAYLGDHAQIARVFTHDDIASAPAPSGPPESWSLIDEAKASFDPDRSGDLLVMLKPRVTPILATEKGYVATHGSPWDYDRRVPILFWRKGLAPFEQPLGVETVDILPTLASLTGLSVPASEIDGRCLDIMAGTANNCP